MKMEEGGAFISDGDSKFKLIDEDRKINSDLLRVFDITDIDIESDSFLSKATKKKPDAYLQILPNGFYAIEDTLYLVSNKRFFKLN